MIKFILIGLGVYLALEDYFESRGKKHANVSKNGDGSRGSNSGGKPRADGQKSDRDGVVTVPIVTKIKGGQSNELHQKPVHKVGTVQGGGGAGNDSGGKPNATSKRGKTESVKEQKSEAKGQKSKEKGVKNEHSSNSKNDAGDNGNDVDTKSSGKHESDSPKVDKG